jgi:hypothetical protein
VHENTLCAQEVGFTMYAGKQYACTRRTKSVCDTRMVVRTVAKTCPKLDYAHNNVCVLIMLVCAIVLW